MRMSAHADLVHLSAAELVAAYRLAPLGEGFREPTEEEKIVAAPKTPFGSAQGADRWAAGNMADVLLGRGDYGDAITHFRGEVSKNRAEAMPYLAAVHEIMGEKNPGLAARFATQMHKAGLTAEPEKKPEGTSGGSVLSAPIPPTVTPGPHSARQAWRNRHRYSRSATGAGPEAGNHAVSRADTSRTDAGTGSDTRTGAATRA